MEGHRVSQDLAAGVDVEPHLVLWPHATRRSGRVETILRFVRRCWSGKLSVSDIVNRNLGSKTASLAPAS